MGTQWIRQEVKKNPLAEWVDKTASWIKANRETAVASAVICLAAIILAVYFVHRYSSLKSQAWEKLFIAKQYAYSGKVEDSIKQLHAVQKGYPKTTAAGFGILFEGDMLYKQGFYKDAARAYQKLVERGKPKPLIPYAMAGIGISQESAMDYKEAIATHRQFLEKYPDHYMAPQAYTAIARCLEATKNREETKLAYERIILLFPNTYWAKQAQEKLQK